MENEKYDVIIITETWLIENPKIINYTYKSISNLTTSNEGISMFFKWNLKVEKLFHELNDSGLLIAKMASDSQNVILIGVYINPNPSIGRNTLKKLLYALALDYINSRFCQYSLLIYGDFNKDIRRNPQRALIERSLQPIYNPSLLFSSILFSSGIHTIPKI